MVSLKDSKEPSNKCLEMAYRATQNKSSGCTPNLVFLNRNFMPIWFNGWCGAQCNWWGASSTVHWMGKISNGCFKRLCIQKSRQSCDQTKVKLWPKLKPRQYKKGEWVWRFSPYCKSEDKLWLDRSIPSLEGYLWSRLLNTKCPGKSKRKFHVDDIKPYKDKQLQIAGLVNMNRKQTKIMKVYLSSKDKLETTLPMKKKQMKILTY